LHTMYADKPIQGHGLMQAITRVKGVGQGLIEDFAVAAGRGLRTASARVMWPRASS
jgi:type I site-specific restriction-modification system R (restriction) subunit